MSEKAPAEVKMIISQSSKYKTCYINFTVYLHLFFGVLASARTLRLYSFRITVDRHTNSKDTRCKNKIRLAFDVERNNKKSYVYFNRWNVSFSLVFWIIWENTIVFNTQSDFTPFILFVYPFPFRNLPLSDPLYSEYLWPSVGEVWIFSGTTQLIKVLTLFTNYMFYSTVEPTSSLFSGERHIIWKAEGRVWC